MFEIDWTLTTFFVFYNILILQLLVLVGIHFFMNYFFFARPLRQKKQKVDHADAPLVSVIFPVGEEINESHLLAALKSLDEQDYQSLEILLPDLSLFSKTVKNYISQNKKIRLIKIRKKAAGWTAVTWQHYELSKNVQGEFVVFTGPEVVHKPDSVRTAWQTLVDEKIDLLSLWPQLQTKKWLEKVLMPFRTEWLLFLYPHWFPGNFSFLGLACDDFVMMSSKKLQSLRAFSKGKQRTYPLLRLAIEARLWGYRIRNLDGCELLQSQGQTRSIQTFKQFPAKLCRIAMESWLSQLIFQPIHIMLFLLPFLFAVLYQFGLLQTHFLVSNLIALQCGLIFILRGIISILFRTSFLSTVLNPFSQLLVHINLLYGRMALLKKPKKF
ncbi:MAG: hypothetical protein AAF984_06530 [Verrucomicrobiota bacterium]